MFMSLNRIRRLFTIIMVPVPAWTREWRPLASELCAHILTSNLSDDGKTSFLSTKTLLLRAERVVRQLYLHRFVDSVPLDVQAQTQALAMTFRVNLLEDRADKLIHLALKCDYLVLKLLLELAANPTTATDEEVAVDMGTKSRWKTVLQHEQYKVEQHKLLQEQVVEELFQISTNDEWYQAWEDSDEDESDWDIDTIDGRVVESDCDIDICHRNVKRSSEALDENNAIEQEQAGSPLTECPEQMARQEMERYKELETLNDELQHNEILCRYYPELSAHVEDMENNDDEPTIVLEKKTLVPFTLRRPWLLCEAVINSAQSIAKTKGVIPSRLIHENTVVRMVFEALYGIDSLLFDFCPINPTPSAFSADFQMKAVKRSQTSQNIAMGHISPLAFQHVLDYYAEAASELEILRTYLYFFHERRNHNEQLRCVMLEGLADALSEIFKSLVDSIKDVEKQAKISCKRDSRPWSGIMSRQPTLIGLLGGLKETFRTASWLKGVLKECFNGLSCQDWHEGKRAKQAKCVLDSLYRILNEEYVKGVAAHATTNYLTRSDLLLHLFIGTLVPYLTLLNQVVFQRGHFDIIPLPGELFFAKSVSIDVRASPMREWNQNFAERLLLLAPFEVDQSLVPNFLESLTSLINEALASRQLQNRFLQQQHPSVKLLTKFKLAGPCLQDILLSELERRGCKRKCGIFSMFDVEGCSTEEGVLSTQQWMLKCMPFNRILEQCLTIHLENKCHELNGEITDIFRDKMNYLDHVNALRMFVLMEQQDVLSSFSGRLVAHMQKNPVAWADSEKINDFYQSALQEKFEDNLLSSAQREIGGRLRLRVDSNLLDSITSGTRIDIATMKCLHYTITIPQPLRVLFSVSIMQKYSMLGILLLQVKAVESTLVKFRSTIRHRRSYLFIEKEIRQALLQIADMLHFTTTLLCYLTTQISNERWSECCNMLQSSRSLAVMDATHEMYLDHLLNRFFLLNKHATVIQYILTTFNHMLCFVGQVDKVVGVVDRNLKQYYPDSSLRAEKSDQDFFCKVPSVSLFEHPDIHILHSEMMQSSKEYKRQLRFLVIMLTAMQKHDASPHVNAMVTQLNYNYFYHQKEHRPQI